MKNNHSFPSPEMVKIARRLFTPGSRVVLIEMNDPYCHLVTGEQGTVTAVDDTGTVFVRWDSGHELGVLYGVDWIRKL